MSKLRNILVSTALVATTFSAPILSTSAQAQTLNFEGTVAAYCTFSDLVKGSMVTPAGQPNVLSTINGLPGQFNVVTNALDNEITFSDADIAESPAGHTPYPGSVHIKSSLDSTFVSTDDASKIDLTGNGLPATILVDAKYAPPGALIVGDYTASITVTCATKVVPVEEEEEEEDDHSGSGGPASGDSLAYTDPTSCENAGYTWDNDNWFCDE